MTFSQVGSDVVGSGSGSIDTKGLSLYESSFHTVNVNPWLGIEITGSPGNATVYTGPLSGPSAFGYINNFVTATSGTGDIVALAASVYDQIGVPEGYVSGAALSGTATCANQTFATLGFTPGTYVYDFGSGADADTFTINIGAPASVPEPASLALLGTGLLGLFLIERRRRNA